MSNNLSNYKTIRERVYAVGKTGFGIVFYSPCNPTNKNIKMVKELLMQYRRPDTIVGIVSNIGNEDQKVYSVQLST